jgi:hypothetical protein
MKIEYAKTIQTLKLDAIYGVDLDNIIWHDDNPTNITKEQILSKQAELQIIEDAKPENVKKASGKQKLLDLGLSEEEVKALIGV